MDPQTQQPYSKDKQEAAKTKADEILAKVKDGDDMEKLVKEYSEDNGAAENKGIYEVTENSQFVTEFKDWAVKAKVGDTGIVKTSYGYHVMKCDKKSTLEDKDVKDQVKALVQQKKITDKLDKLEKDKVYKVEKNVKAINKIDIPVTQ